MIDTIDDLRQRFEVDQASGPQQLISSDELPLSYEAITDEWLSDALSPLLSGARIVGHRFGPPDNGSSERRTLVVDYDEAGADLNLRTRFFCKASMAMSSRVAIGFTGAAEAESGFYQNLRPHLDIEAPTGFYGKVDPENLASMVIIDDISDRVLEFGHHTTKVTRKRAESQLDTLAEVHSLAYANPQAGRYIETLRTWPDVFERTLALGLREACTEGFRMAGDILPRSIFAREGDIWPKTLESLELHRRNASTYVHCDVHLRNWYVTKDDRMGLADWQCAARGHWSRDLAYCMSVGLDTQDRRAWEHELIIFYLDRLARHGGPRPTFDEAFQAYRAQLMTVLAWWTVTLNPAADMPDELQPRDSTLCFLKRIGAAMEDLDTLDAF